MRFFAVIATLFAAASAHYSAESSACSTVTVTVTVPYGNVPTGPASVAPTLPPYPTTGAPYPSVVPSGTGYPVVPVPSGTGAPAPSGTGSYTTPPPSEFTGAASNMKIPAAAAAAMGFAAYFL